jgi:hypothetical protein
VWEEKPALMNLTETKWKFRSATASGGRKEAAAGAATFVGYAAVQQSMGHLAPSSATDKLAIDSAGAAPWW